MKNPSWPALNPEDYEDVDIDDPDNPELTEQDFAKARPVREALPDLYEEVVRKSPKKRKAS